VARPLERYLRASLGRQLGLRRLLAGEAARDDAVERLGDLGDALADDVMEPARRHDRDDGIFESVPLIAVQQCLRYFAR
jgi:hypothetical protein